MSSSNEVLTIGSFDILHSGHISLLQTCKKLGKLTVGVNSDAFMESYKGTPVMNEEERLHALKLLGYTVLLNHSAGRELIDEVKPDLIAIGSDWARKDYLSQIDVTWDYLDENKIGLVYLPRVTDISTTQIKQRIYETSPNRDVL